MRNKISKPRIYTNSTLWLMASGALSFDWIAKKNVELNEFAEPEFQKYFLNNKIFNSTPTDISFVDGNNIPGSGDFFLYAQGSPYGMEQATSKHNRFWDTVIVLNHNFSRFLHGGQQNITFKYITDNNYPEGDPPIYISDDTILTSNEINFTKNSFDSSDIMDGFSLGEINHPATQKSGMGIKINYPSGHTLPGSSSNAQVIYPFFHIGSFFCAKRFDFDRSADLEMEIEYVYDGIKKQNSINGSTHLNTYHTGRPNWGVNRPFECNTYGNLETLFENQINSRVTNNGRRRFKIKFSYLEDKRAFNTWTSYRAPTGFTFIGQPDYTTDYTNASQQNASGNLSGTDTFEGVDDGSLFEGFISRTLGGKLPFIMCLDPDEDDTRGLNPDNWAMCMLDGDSIRFTKVADDFYDVELTIDEVF